MNNGHIDVTAMKSSWFQMQAVLFEVHRAFAIFNDPECAKLLDDLLFAAFKRLETAALEGYSFPMFPPLENGLVLLGHINQHLEEWLGLRQILDWALYVDKALDDDAWEMGRNSFCLVLAALPIPSSGLKA